MRLKKKKKMAALWSCSANAALISVILSSWVSTFQLSFLETLPSLNLYHPILLFACYGLSVLPFASEATMPSSPTWTGLSPEPHHPSSPLLTRPPFSSLGAPRVCLWVLELCCQPPFWMMLLRGQHLTFISPLCLIVCQA